MSALEDTNTDKKFSPKGKQSGDWIEFASEDDSKRPPIPQHPKPPGRRAGQNQKPHTSSNSSSIDGKEVDGGYQHQQQQEYHSSDSADKINSEIGDVIKLDEHNCRFSAGIADTESAMIPSTPSGNNKQHHFADESTMEAVDLSSSPTRQQNKNRTQIEIPTDQGNRKLPFLPSPPRRNTLDSPTKTSADHFHFQRRSPSPSPPPPSPPIPRSMMMTTTLTNVPNTAKTASTGNNASTESQQQKSPELFLGVGLNNGATTLNTPPDAASMLKNGKLMASVYPINEHCAWITPPIFDPTTMPKMFTREGQFALAPHLYVDVMSTITCDIRFKAYCLLFSRIAPIWLIFSVISLLAFLASSPAGGITVMVLSLLWMAMLAVGFFFCLLIRKYLAKGLRESVKEANRMLYPYRLLLGVKDEGQLSCHKIRIFFLYYDWKGCFEEVCRLVKVSHANRVVPQPTPLSETETEHIARNLLLSYSQKYGKSLMKRELLFPTRPSEGVSEFLPKHVPKSWCLCQFIDKLNFDPERRRSWFERVFMA